MVDVIGQTDAVVQVADIVDGCEDIVFDDVFWHQIVASHADGFFQCFFIIAASVQNFAEYGETYFFQNAQFFAVEVYIVMDINHAVGDNFNFFIANFQESSVDTCALDLFCFCAGDDLAFVSHQFTGTGVDDRLRQNMANQTAADAQFFIVFVAANAGQIISSCIEEEHIDMALCAVNCWRFTRTEFTVNFQQTFFGVVGAVFFQSSQHLGIAAEEVQNLCIAGETQCTDKGSYRQFSVFVDTNVEHIVGIGFILQPCATVRNNSGRVQCFTCFVAAHCVVNARRTNQLRYDNTFCTINDEGTAIGHQWEIAHEDILFFYFAGFLIEEAGTYTQRCGVSSVALFAFFDAVLWFIFETIIDKVKHQIALIVGNRRNIFEYFLNSFFQEPFVRVFLNFDEVWHLQNFIDTRKAHSLNILPELYRFHIHHSVHPLHSLLLKASKFFRLFSVYHYRKFSQFADFFVLFFLKTIENSKSIWYNYSR